MSLGTIFYSLRISLILFCLNFFIILAISSGYLTNNLTYSFDIINYFQSINSWLLIIITYIFYTSLLIYSYNYLIKKILKIQNQLIHKEKLASLGLISNSIAHELNNFLAIISVTNQLNAMSNNLDETKNNIQNIETQIKRATEVINTIKNFSRLDYTSKKELTNLNTLIEEIINLKKLQFKNQNIIIEKHFENSIEIMINKSQIQQVMMNLIQNSHHAILPKKEGKIYIMLKKTNNKAILIVKDTGIGIDKTIINKIFKPYTTTKTSDDFSEKGSGLGLSITYSIIESHGGNISCESEKNKGTKFTIELPLIQK